MQSTHLLTCPKCETPVLVASLGFAFEREPNGDGSGTILKRCPRCRTWSWMTLERQETA